MRQRWASHLPPSFLQPRPVATRSLNAEAQHPAQKYLNAVLAHYSPHFLQRANEDDQSMQYLSQAAQLHFQF
jgi:hypothetical protein